MKKVSVVILNWNGEQMLRQFLPTVVSCSAGEEVEVCVADNASTDASVQWLRNEFPAVRLIVLDRNYGFAEGYNRALEQVDAEYVVLLNSDVEVTPHWLEPLVTFMDARKWPHANPSCWTSVRNPFLNMPELLVAIWINTDTPSVGAVSSMRLKKTMDNTTLLFLSFG